MTLPVNDYKDLDVWREAMELCRRVYRMTSNFPDDERFGLTSQMRRAVVSIPSNIAEGYGRGSRQEYIRFVRIARGSVAELETQILLASDLLALDEADVTSVSEQLGSVIRLVQGLLNALDR